MNVTNRGSGPRLKNQLLKKLIRLYIELNGMTSRANALLVSFRLVYKFDFVTTKHLKFKGVCQLQFLICCYLSLTDEKITFSRLLISGYQPEHLCLLISILLITGKLT